MLLMYPRNIMTILSERENFVEDQVRFMYGSYYKVDSFSEECNIPVTHHGGPEESSLQEYDPSTSVFLFNQSRNDWFAQNMKKYCPRSNALLRMDFQDVRFYRDKFVVTHTRKHGYKNQVIFPLLNHNNPKWISIKDHEPEQPFREKINGLVWRGGTLGDFYGQGLDHHLRYLFLNKTWDIHDEIDMGFSTFAGWTYEQNKEAFHRYQKPFMTHHEITQYKFVLNLEGHDFASSFQTMLASNSCPLHNYPFSWETYFFARGLEPYVHFVPVKSDGSDLVQQYEWCMNNLDKCEVIAQNGKRYMEPYLDEELFYAVIKRFAELYPLKIPSG